MQGTTRINDIISKSVLEKGLITKREHDSLVSDD